MAVTLITYAADEALAVTEWDATLAAGQTATSAIYSNTSNLYIDVLIGGILELDATTPAVGDTMDIYIAGQYDTDTATDMGAGLDALFVATDENVADTEFVLANLTLVTSVAVQATSTFGDAGFHWGPIGVAQFFGGIMPKAFMLLLHNNTAGTMAAGPDVNIVGITYTST